MRLLLQLRDTNHPAFYTGHLLETVYLHRLDDEHLIGMVTVEQLAGLGTAVDAAQQLDARRGYLADSAENTALEQLIREHPEEFGRIGSIALGAEELLWIPDPSRGSGTVQLMGATCLDGLQRIKLLAHLSGEAGFQRIAHNQVELHIHIGASRAPIQRAYDHEHLYRNGATAQDLLIREPEMLRLIGEFLTEEVHLAVLRGSHRGPYADGYTVEEATEALALFRPGDDPGLAHLALSPAGRELIWGSPASEPYRSLFHPGTTAVGVRRAILLRRQMREGLRKLAAAGVRAHRHLLADVPDLIVWEAARRLPLAELHAPAADWHPFEAAATALAEDAAERLVAGYRAYRPKKVRDRKEVQELAVWQRLLSEARSAGRAAEHAAGQGAERGAPIE
ncbi:hypothetical protein ACIRBX_08170 [Kitasatospora sp. NPDC096147]|uniref:hypothetical protein n=1 Tax=Kitasatospora sp. NPDC096147 TaxID=3364093 RepID=UPI00382EF3C3